MAYDRSSEFARIESNNISLFKAVKRSGHLYRTVLVDPPWPSSTQTKRGHWLSNNTKPRYQTMSRNELMELGVSDIAEPDAMLVMWATWMHLPLAFELIHQWGFEYCTGFPWLKTVRLSEDEWNKWDEGYLTSNRAIPKPIFGPGVWVQHCTELILLARRGKPFGKLGNPRPARQGIIISPRGEHSEKPVELHEWLESKFPEPRIELFARQRREGWTCWGNELQ